MDDVRSTVTCAFVRFLRCQGLALAALALAGCMYAPVRIGYETDGHLTTSTGEHLYRVHATELGALYLKPGVEFGSYDAVAFRYPTLAYRSPPKMGDYFDHTPGNYRLRLDASDRLRRDLSRALSNELARSRGFRVVPEPTSGGLRISPHIVHLRWEAPPDQGGESLYLRRTGSMTLILDVRDAETGALLARLADARLIKPSSSGLAGAFESSPVNNWAGVRDVCTHWAWLLRATLETLRVMPPLPAP